MTYTVFGFSFSLKFYYLSQDRDQQKMTWIGKFVDELKNDKWVLPALKQIREICQLFPEVNYGCIFKLFNK